MPRSIAQLLRLNLDRAAIPVDESGDALFSEDNPGYMVDQATQAALARVPMFVGDIWYVDSGMAASGDGSTPHEAMQTISEAVAAASAGDAITVKAGTYTEEGLNMNLNSLELWPEIGVILDPANGTALTISGNFCKVWCPGGLMFITPGANDTGVQITGKSCYVSDVRVKCASVADIGFHVGSAADNTDGDGSVLTNCRSSSPLIAAFKIQANMVKLEDCCTGGETGDSSIGFWMTPDASGNIDKTRLKNCGSQGHETSGFQVDTGCTNGVIEGCYSGGGDGKWSDADDAFVWAHFAYDDIVYATTTFNGGTTYNMFQVTGAVRISNIYGHVETPIPNVASNLHLELYSTGGAPDITLGPGTNIQAAVVGALLVRNAGSTVAIDLANPSATPAIAEHLLSKIIAIDIVEDNTNLTYIRAVLSAAQASGAIHWHCHWEPLTDDGFLESA